MGLLVTGLRLLVTGERGEEVLAFARDLREETRDLRRLIVL